MFNKSGWPVVTRFKAGDKVKKVSGDYHVSGVVRSAFTKEDGAVRYVVEIKAEGGGSFLMIYSDANLELATVATGVAP